MPRLKINRPVVLKKLYDNTPWWDAIQDMAERMGDSEEKYGPIITRFPIPHKAHIAAQIRLKKYLKHGDRQDLLDAANFLLIEYLRPSHPKAFLEASEALDETIKDND